jgi:hypothetical protein
MEQKRPSHLGRPFSFGFSNDEFDNFVLKDPDHFSH